MVCHVASIQMPFIVVDTLSFLLHQLSSNVVETGDSFVLDHVQCIGGQSNISKLSKAEQYVAQRGITMTVFTWFANIFQTYNGDLGFFEARASNEILALTRNTSRVL